MSLEKHVTRNYVKSKIKIGNRKYRVTEELKFKFRKFRGRKKNIYYYYYYYYF